MAEYGDLDIGALPDELLVALLEAFARKRCWTEIVQYQHAASEIIRQQLTHQFYAFIYTQIAY